jgi:hypothetical protein
MMAKRAAAAAPCVLMVVLAAALCAEAVTVTETPQTSVTSTFTDSQIKPPFIPLSSLAKTVPGCAPEQVTRFPSTTRACIKCILALVQAPTQYVHPHVQHRSS